MAAYTMDGVVKVLMDEQTFDSGFTKREFVVTTKEDKYPQDIKFEAVKDRTAILNGVNPGDEVTVTFDLRGNEYKDRYYVNLVAWKLDKMQAGGAPVAGQPGLAEEPREVPDDFDDIIDRPF
ncbi:MAG: DUF3127 domain-containing protein [Kiritimatiellae bacterium]|nr:DUF3127 domain-containing protein [Kiritimatiellia bacterium]MDD4735746.1 DUF3127 domain-containing protein [Kiritimatiellia bacterium]